MGATTMIMNDNEQIKAIAELDGLYFGNTEYDTEECWRNNLGIPKIHLKSYLTSLDAIVSVIKKQSFNRKTSIDAYLTNLIRVGQIEWEWLATPRQLCEALLRATGKWKD